MRIVAPAPPELVTELVNGWSEAARREAGVLGRSLPSLDEVLDRYSWRIGSSGPAEHVTAVADALHPVFATDSVAERLELLNELIAGLRPTPLASMDGPRWMVIDDRRELEASLVLGLVEYGRIDPGYDRLGTCAAHRCVDAYIDASQAGRRRYCSITCQNRAKAAAFRRRRSDRQASR